MLGFIFGSSKPKAVPEAIRSALREKLGTDSRQLDQCQALERGGRYAGRKVRHVRVFDPRLLKGLTGPVTYVALDTQKAAIVFEGHFEQNGGLVISDRRQVAPAASTA
jgi:hypothetical protein